MAVVEVDFSNIEEGGYLLEGQYAAEVEDVEIRDGQSGYPYLNWRFRSIEPGYEGQVGYLMTSLSPKALWRLRDALVALGAQVSGEAQKIDTDKLVGLRGVVVVINEPYEGSDGNMHDSHKIDRVFPLKDDNIAEAPTGPLTPDTSDFEKPTTDDDIPF